MTQSNGYGIYDSGGSAVYGFDFLHKIKNNIEFFGGLAQNVRLGKDIDDDIIADYTGYRRTISDLLGNFGMRLYSITTTGYFNYDLHLKELRYFGVSSSFGYNFTENQFIMLSLNYNSFSKNANLFGQQLETYY